MRAIVSFSALVLVYLCAGCADSHPELKEAQAQLTAIRQAGLLGSDTVRIGAVRLIQPVDTRWGPAAQPFWWAELQGPDGSAGYLAWQASGGRRLLDFSLEGVKAVTSPSAKAIGGIPPIQQFAIAGADGVAVASGCVPTAGASLIAFWSRESSLNWRAGADEQALVSRVRARMPMVTITDLEGYTDGKMSLAGASPMNLALAMKQDADERKVKVGVDFTYYNHELLCREIIAGRPVLVSCVVLVPRKPTLAWGHQVVAVGWAKIGEENFVGIIDNFFEPRLAGSIRWIANGFCQTMVTVRPGR
jgi:hypothetical protein